jgi:hypothetical protein
VTKRTSLSDTETLIEIANSHTRQSFNSAEPFSVAPFDKTLVCLRVMADFVSLTAAKTAQFAYKRNNYANVAPHRESALIDESVLMPLRMATINEQIMLRA